MRILEAQACTHESSTQNKSSDVVFRINQVNVEPKILFGIACHGFAKFLALKKHTERAA